MSGIVTSQARHFPCFHGINVTSSERFPSVLSKPVGSFDAEILARLIPRHIISLTALCLVTRPALLLHDKPCVPLHSTVLPQWQSCASQSLTLSLSPVATLIVSFVFRRPTAVIGGARSQSPECGAVAARSLALSRGQPALSNSSVEFFFVTALFVSFIIRRPTAVIGGARSQSPACGAVAARSLALSRG